MTESAPKNTFRKVVEVSDLPPGTAFSQLGKTYIVTDEDVPVPDEAMEFFREMERRNEEREREAKKRREELERMGRESELKWRAMERKWEREEKEKEDASDRSWSWLSGIFKAMGDRKGNNND